MNPDPRESLPLEILEELMEEGAEAFRNVLEKLFNLAMELERSEFLGADPYQRDGAGGAIMPMASKARRWRLGWDG